ncbi:MAG: uridine diphosphate-N-acetylglucosamine-binding protein YvcK [Actinomycetota bacterium]|nr:uridine diphosphate-N-acetylglucosamine-binding protein YvcK [Actinomycetota bacterium]
MTGPAGRDGDGYSAGAVGRGPGDGSRAVAIGGGHGLSRCLQALTHVVDHVTAVVTTADDGGSSGRLRELLGVIPPGDLRMALTALSPRRDLVRLMQYRFASGELGGHSLGNLVIVATTDLNSGDIVAALDYVAAVLDARGRVLPCTTHPVQLSARAGDEEIAGQVAVARSQRIRQVWLEPAAPPATPAAVEAIRRADLVVLGPGSLFTSIIPNLLVPGIAEAVRAATCPVVLVANLREQPGETEGLDLPAHVDALIDHAAGIRLSAIVAHRGRPVTDGRPLTVDEAALTRFTSQVVVADVLDPRGGHEPVKLAVALGRVLRPGRAALG